MGMKVTPMPSIVGAMTTHQDMTSFHSALTTDATDCRQHSQLAMVTILDNLVQHGVPCGTTVLAWSNLGHTLYGLEYRHTRHACRCQGQAGQH